jgi:hypothetical protein
MVALLEAEMETQYPSSGASVPCEDPVRTHTAVKTRFVAWSTESERNRANRVEKGVGWSGGGGQSREQSRVESKTQNNRQTTDNAHAVHSIADRGADGGAEGCPFAFAKSAISISISGPIPLQIGVYAGGPSD